ncbi:Lon protease family protein [Azoarcus sp. KH32C]|uniref:Lon protease family protein n=1 Tax=Azoarcus sp. KH32C TaxID=748247 RepID=UPI00023863F4|nr:AAA family ATPase [Azoarcus sp. KH32C]BAL25172.1 putative ATP-dependent protease [Azoarcus sp. KH32C]
MARPGPLSAENLCRRCMPDWPDFETTDDLVDLPGGLGQARAEQALRFGLAIGQPGYHLFVLGEAGTGRHAVALRLLREFAERREVPPDLCYLNDFDNPHRPRLLKLPAGRGAALHAQMQTFIADLGPAIEAALEADTHRDRVDSLLQAHKSREEKALRELGEACSADGVSLLQTPEGFVFAPTANGEAMSPDAFEALPPAERAAIEGKVSAWSEKLADLLDDFPGWRTALRESVKRAARDALAPAVTHLIRPMRETYAELPEVLRFLDAVAQDVLENAAEQESLEDEDEAGEDGGQRFHRYQVKLLVDHSSTHGAPIVYEDNPVFGNLIGRVEFIAQMGVLITHFNLIRAGALHRACGGYLVVDADRLLTQPFAWEGLKRALRAREVRIEPPAEAQGWTNVQMLEPEPVPCDVKVILIGDRELFYLLTENDPDFPDLFKVAADFDDDMLRTDTLTLQYVRLLATLARASNLLPVNREGLARMVEEGARLAEDAGRLSLQTRHLADLLREADYHARQSGVPVVGAPQIDGAIAARARRFGRYSERVLESMLDGTTLISTDGTRCGQVNGLVIVEIAGEQFGHPVRITATARLGEGDVVDIERETELGGAIHSKGVLILSAFLAARYARHQPLSLAASLVFEQSYGPVEGDSASLAELCCLLSALAQVPIRQCFAVTGSVNQFGEVQAIGRVNEKIEGFFQLCRARGLTGEQGVLIPAASVKQLMLREEVVEAARAGRFHVFPVANVDEAITLLTGMEAGIPDAKGILPRESVNHRVAEALAVMTSAKHAADQSGGRKPRHRRREED